MEPDRRERIAKALADPRRWRILELARETPDLSCGEFVAALGLSQPTISHHISTLAEAGLIAVRRDGTCFRVTLVPEVLAEYRKELEWLHISPQASSPGALA